LNSSSDSIYRTLRSFFLNPAAPTKSIIYLFKRIERPGAAWMVRALAALPDTISDTHKHTAGS